MKVPFDPTRSLFKVCYWNIYERQDLLLLLLVLAYLSGRVIFDLSYGTHTPAGQLLSLSFFPTPTISQQTLWECLPLLVCLGRMCLYFKNVLRNFLLPSFLLTLVIKCVFLFLFFFRMLCVYIGGGEQTLNTVAPHCLFLLLYDRIFSSCFFLTPSL